MDGVFSGRHSMSPLGEMRGAACRYAACHMSCTLSHAWRACRVHKHYLPDVHKTSFGE